MIWVELVFMMLVLKIPVVYVCVLVWWAVKQEPRPLEGAVVTAGTDDSDPRGGRWRRRRRPRPPHGRPTRSYARGSRARAARTRTRR